MPTAEKVEDSLSRRSVDRCGGTRGGGRARGADPSPGDMKINAMNCKNREGRRRGFSKIREDRDDGLV